MQLSVRDRIILLSVIPQTGDFLTLKIVRKLGDSLSFSEEEHKLYNFKPVDTGVVWDDSHESVKDIEIGEKANDIIVNAFKKLNDSKQLKMEHFDLYERFVGESNAK